MWLIPNECSGFRVNYWGGVFELVIYEEAVECRLPALSRVSRRHAPAVA